MKISAKTNAALWGALALVAIAGVPATILHSGFLGPIPILGSLIAGMAVARLAYSQWQTEQTTVEFIRTAPFLIAGVVVVLLLSMLDDIYS